jgi:hypothetical protein
MEEGSHWISITSSWCPPSRKKNKRWALELYHWISITSSWYPPSRKKNKRWA